MNQPIKLALDEWAADNSSREAQVSFRKEEGDELPDAATRMLDAFKVGDPVGVTLDGEPMRVRVTAYTFSTHPPRLDFTVQW